MIIKYFDLKKNLDEKINFILLYGSNNGLIEEIVENILKPKFSSNVFNYDENEILNKLDTFKEGILSKSFFDNDKLIIINRATDKLLNIVQELIKTTCDMKLKEFIYNKDTKESNLAGVLFVVLVAAICIGILYYFFWI